MKKERRLGSRIFMGLIFLFLYAPILLMMVIVIICMWIMNRFGEGEEQAVVL